MTKILPVLTCLECRDPFTARPRQDGSYSRLCSRRCSRTFYGKLRRGCMPAVLQAALQSRRQRARARAEQALRREFAPITDREARIFAAGDANGYKRGHNDGYRAGQRRQAS